MDDLMANDGRRAKYLEALAVEGLHRSTFTDGSTHEQRSIFNVLESPGEVHLATTVRPYFLAPNFWRPKEWRKLGGDFKTPMTPVRYYQYRIRLYKAWSVDLWSLCPMYWRELRTEYHAANGLQKLSLRVQVLAEDFLCEILNLGLPISSVAASNILCVLH